MVGLGSWGWVKNQRCLHNEQVRGGEKLPLNVAKRDAGWRNYSVDCRILAGLTRTSLGLHLLWSVLGSGEKESLNGSDPGSRGKCLDVVQMLQLLGIFRWGSWWNGRFQKVLALTGVILMSCVAW